MLIFVWSKKANLPFSLFKLLKTVFNELLNSNEDIDINAHFILDLGATSLDYLTLLVKLEEKYDIKFNNNIEPNYTILQFASYIVGKIN